MRAKPIFVFTCIFLIIFLIGLISSSSIHSLIERAHKLMGPGNVMVVVAKHDYPKWTTITDPEQMFELREFGYFDFDVPQAAYEEVNDVPPGFILMIDIHEGQPLGRRHLLSTPLTKEGKLELPGPGREYLLIPTAQAREDSIQVGTRVDVIDSNSKEDPQGKSKILLHDVLVRGLIPKNPFLQYKLNQEGKRNLVALLVLVETSAAESHVFQASDKNDTINEIRVFYEVRPSIDDKKVDKKNSAKVP
jgi:hypothetical protein